ncbi:hypothetical protein L345_13540, partial [Ophiophagus hannah]
MVEKSLAVAVHLVLASIFWLLCPTLVDSTPSICPRCPADPEFLQKIRLQIMWLKQPTRELYKSYLTGMDLQDELREFCEVPVAWLPRRNITKEPERLLLQELYAAVVRMERALKALDNQLADEEKPVPRQLATVSLSLTGLLSNIQCAQCRRALRPVPVAPSERSQDSSSFNQKIEGCQTIFEEFSAWLKLDCLGWRRPLLNPRRSKQVSQTVPLVFTCYHEIKAVIYSPLLRDETSRRSQDQLNGESFGAEPTTEVSFSGAVASPTVPKVGSPKGHTKRKEILEKKQPEDC